MLNTIKLRNRRTVVVGALALTLGVFAFLYRLNALGGALGGFDNDHFIYFVRARQVALGERPLRDFADAGLQGAWPSLTYLVSAAGLRWMEMSLWPEGLLGAAGIAGAVVLMFIVTARVAPVWASLVTAVLTLFLGTKLYNWPRLVIFAVATMLMTWYARRPSAAVAALLGGWAAAAFLFRHDFAVYVAVAVVVLIAACHRLAEWRRVAAHVAIAGAMTALLVAPSLAWVQRYEGLGRYVRANIEMGRRETERTTLRWPRFVRDGEPPAAMFDREENAIAWLYYLFWALPVAAVIAAGRAQWPGFDARRLRALVLSLAALTLALDYFFLRGNVGARFGDIGAPLAVLAAVLMSPRVGEGLRKGALRFAVIAALLLVTTASVFTVGVVARELDTTGLSDSWEKVQRRFVTVRTQLRAMPWGGPGSLGVPLVSEYLRACTHPGDRVMVVASAPEILALANRAFAGGHPTFIPGFYGSIDDQQLTLRRLARQRVPVVITQEEELYTEDFATGFPLIHQYLQQHYERAGSIDSGDEPMQVLVSRFIVPAGTHPPTGLPCFA